MSRDGSLTRLGAMGVPARAEQTAWGRDRSDRLSPREREILLLAAHGMSDAEISTALSISPRTVGAHLANIREKLCAKNRTHLVVRALRAGVLALHPEGPFSSPGADPEETFRLTGAA